MREHLAIRRLKRANGIDQKQAVGIDHDLLIKMIDAKPKTIACNRNRTLLSLDYDFLARQFGLFTISNEDQKNHTRQRAEG